MTQDTLVETTKGNIKILRFNKPQRKNAIDKQMYIKLINVLNDAASNDDISMVVLTGTGKFYSSGNDLKAIRMLTGDLLDLLDELCIALIKFPKLLVAIVNGPAVGIAVTTLPLCDFVFASEDAYFYTPFGKLGIVPEVASTYTLPRLIGQRKALELLVFDKKMSANEALACGLVNNVWKSDELQSKAWERIEDILKISQKSIVETKKLFRKPIMDKILEANKSEMEILRTFCYTITSKL